jgi:hypothetical protein
MNALPAAAALALLGVIAMFPAGVAASTPDPLFADDVPLAVTIRAPFSQLARDRADDPEYVSGKLSFTDHTDAVVTLDVRLRPRGKSRRRTDVCRFPPLRLNFPDRSQTKDTLFDKQTNLKLATYCRETERHQQIVLKELVTYRMFNHLAEHSFRVRMLEIDYVDTDSNDRPLTRYGFFIEDRRRLGKRIGLPSKRPDQIPAEALEPVQASLVEVFNYMLGNTDYSLIAPPPGDRCCHNAYLYRLPDDRYLPIPYDFDMTGFVNPPYGMVAPGLRIRNVRQRLFRGLCRDGDHHATAIEQLREARGALFDIVRQQQGLDPDTAEKAISYLQGFFDIVDDPRRRDQQIMQACR